MKHSDSYTTDNEVVLVRGGSSYFKNLLELIHSANHSIHIQVYIFDDDETGKIIGAALGAAAARNVGVYVLADGYASQRMSKNYIKVLRNAGIHFRFFEPILQSRSWYFGRRLHHKVAVADGRHALVGGVNIDNRYNDMPGKFAWLDFAVYAKGQIAAELQALCIDTWNSTARRNERIQPATAEAPDNNNTGTALVRLRRNDWVRRKNEISRTYVEMLMHAQREVTILCSYFLPGKIIRRQIVHAARRGVRITVIAAGQSDVVLSKHAERWLYDWLLRHGIRLYEYYGNVLHGKLAVCDGEMVTIGSYNLNNISTYASIELNLDVKDKSFANTTEQMLHQLISQHCIAVTPEQHRHTKNIFSQFIRWFSYQFIRILFYFFTFYFKRQSSKLSKQ